MLLLSYRGTNADRPQMDLGQGSLPCVCKKNKQAVELRVFRRQKLNLKINLLSFSGFSRAHDDSLLSNSLSAEARESDGDLDQRYYTGPNLVEDGEISDDNDLTSMHSSELYTLKTLEYLDDMVGTDDPWFIYLSFQVRWL